MVLMVLVLASGVPAFAQGTGTQPAAVGTVDKQVLRSRAEAPAPTPLDQVRGPTMALPTGPLEPFLVQPENGPFMVLAHTFRGPDAARYAQALTIELRNKFKLPAYIFYAKVQPGHSNIRNIPPTAPPYVRNGEMAAPEKFRNYDEAAVLVGDCKTIGESNQLLHTVKKLRPACLEALPSIYQWRRNRGLSRALLTTNPLVPAQYLYGGKGNRIPVLKPGQAFDPSVIAAGFEGINRQDPFVRELNAKRPLSIYKCPGPYVLQVAEFTGRTTVNLDSNGATPKVDQGMVRAAVSSAFGTLTKTDDLKEARRFEFEKGSPLVHAAEDAEKLAKALTKCKTLGKSQLRPYVYHDRSSSRVYLGPFRGPDDPALIALMADPTNGSMVPATGLKVIMTDQVSKIVFLSNELVRDHKLAPLAPANQLTSVGKD
jgi:hypothetical protein